MPFIPLYDRILVLPAEDTNRQIDGIALPDSAREDFKAGVIVAVGEGYVNNAGEVRPLRLRTGDTVLYGPYCGIPIQLSGSEFLVMKEAEVAGRVIPDE